MVENILDNHLFKVEKVEKKQSFYFKNLLLFVIGLIIWAGDLIAYHYWYRAYKHLGWWPVYAHPDPRELGWVKHHSLVNIALWMALLSVVLWVGIFVTSKKKKLNLINIFFGVLGIYFFLYLFTGDFFDWYAD